MKHSQHNPLAIKPAATTLLSLATLALTACSGGTGGSSDIWYQLAHSPNLNKGAWYNAAAQVCNANNSTAPTAGCDFYWTGSKVTLAGDPHVAGLSGVSLQPGYYVDNGNWGVDDQVIVPGTVGHPAILLFDASQNTAPLNYNGWIISYNGTADFNGQSYGTLSALSPDGVLYDAYGSALNFAGSENASAGRDILRSAAEKEAASIQVLSQGLQAKYGLDSEASTNMAKVIAQDIKRPANRAYSMNELNAMSTAMYNVELGDIKRVSELAQAGDLAAAKEKAQALINTAAAANRTSPENMQRMLNDFYGNLLPAGTHAQ